MTHPEDIHHDNQPLVLETPDQSRPYLEEHPLSRAIDPKHAGWAFLLLLICSALSFWSWQPGHAGLLSASAELVYGQHEYFRLFLSPFLHADIVHLLANSGLFFVFGVLLRNYFGPMTFPFLSLIGAWATQALALLTYDPGVRLIGASGMVYFMAGLWIILFFRYANYLTILQRLMRSTAFILVVLLPTQIEANVSYRSHAIGFALGLFLGWLAMPWTKPVPMTEEEKARGKMKADARRRLLTDSDDDEEIVSSYEIGRFQVRRLRPWMRDVDWDETSRRSDKTTPDA